MQNLRHQIVARSEDPSSHQTVGQNAEPELDLIQPRGVGGRVGQTDAVLAARRALDPFPLWVLRLSPVTRNFLRFGQTRWRCRRNSSNSTRRCRCFGSAMILPSCTNSAANDDRAEQARPCGPIAERRPIEIRFREHISVMMQ